MILDPWNPLKSGDFKSHRKWSFWSFWAKHHVNCRLNYGYCHFDPKWPKVVKSGQIGVKKGSRCSKSMKTMQKVVSTPRTAVRGVANQRGSKWGSLFRPLISGVVEIHQPRNLIFQGRDKSGQKGGRKTDPPKKSDLLGYTKIQGSDPKITKYLPFWTHPGISSLQLDHFGILLFLGGILDPFLDPFLDHFWDHFWYHTGPNCWYIWTLILTPFGSKKGPYLVTFGVLHAASRARRSTAILF